MTERAAIPVTVVTGFLGAGKTTLLNRWLADIPRGDVAVVVNEHGDVGIDGDLLAARVRALVEITGGCVCCTTQAELVRALSQLAASPQPPKRIVVETSGAASPAGVIHAVVGSARSGGHLLDGILTVVDGTRLESLYEHDLAIEQMGYADIVVLSRAELCNAEEITSAKVAVASYNGAALVVTASRGQLDDPRLVPLEALLEERRRDFAAPRDLRSRAHRDYDSVSLVIDGEVDGDRFAGFMESELGGAAGRIFRTKGVLAVAGVAPRMIVQGVADLIEVTFEDLTEARASGGFTTSDRTTSRLVVVGFVLDHPRLRAAFAECAANAPTSVA